MVVGEEGGVRAPHVPVIPGYEIVDVIGRGGFATVYRAVQESVDRVVALKVVSASSLDVAAERRFRDECRSVGELSWHPHVVSLYDAGPSDEGAYLAMELVPGGSWGDRVRADGARPVDEVVNAGIQVADALGVAHDAGIIHRDIKPENLMIGRRGEALLADFGIATLASESRSTTGSFTGTVAFSAPELLQGHRASARSDVFSLGATLHALLSGSAPFALHSDESPAAVMWRVVSGAPTPLPARVPEALADLISSCLAKDPDVRPQSAAEVEAALRSIGAGPTSSPPLITEVPGSRADRARSRSPQPSVAPGPPLVVAPPAGAAGDEGSGPGSGTDPGGGPRHPDEQGTPVGVGDPGRASSAGQPMADHRDHPGQLDGDVAATREREDLAPDLDRTVPRPVGPRETEGPPPSVARGAAADTAVARGTTGRQTHGGGPDLGAPPSPTGGGGVTRRTGDAPALPVGPPPESTVQRHRSARRHEAPPGAGGASSPPAGGIVRPRARRRRSGSVIVAASGVAVLILIVVVVLAARSGPDPVDGAAAGRASTSATARPTTTRPPPTTTTTPPVASAEDVAAADPSGYYAGGAAVIDCSGWQEGYDCVEEGLKSMTVRCREDGCAARLYRQEVPLQFDGTSHVGELRGVDLNTFCLTDDQPVAGTLSVSIQTQEAARRNGRWRSTLISGEVRQVFAAAYTCTAFSRGYSILMDNVGDG